MEDDDPVVQEFPIYLCKALAENLHIFQYPVRPANRDFKNVKVTNASIKPKNQIVRMEIGLNTYSDKYCPSKGEQIALNTDGVQESRYIKDKERDRSQYFRNGTMDKIVYESSTPCNDFHYGIAMLQDKEVHCTPLKGILQMRPSYSYYDKQDKKKLEKIKTDNSDEEEKEPEAQQVTVKFARVETEVAKKAKEKSYESISQRIANEPWYDTLFKHSGTDHSDLECMKLFCSTTSDGSSLTLKAQEYINALVPVAAEDVDTSATVVTTIDRLSLQDRIREILINAKLMTFWELVKLVHAEEGLVVSALGASGCCVRGLWAPRSSQLYTQPSQAPQSARRAARDHVLYLFTQHSYVDRRKIAAAVRLPPQEVLEILQSVAKFNPNKGWELLLPPDTAFEAKYPEVVQRQNLYWEARQRIFKEMLIGENVPKRQRKKSQRDSVSSDTMLSPKSRADGAASPKPRNNSVSEDDKRKKGVKRTRQSSNQDT